VEEVRYTYRIVVLMPREETIGRPEHSCKGSSKIHRRELRNEGVDWIKLAEDWVWWLGLWSYINGLSG
jgi:hypothetical protein